MTKQKVRNDLVVDIVQKVLAGEKANNWDISIVFIGCAKIKELNKKFRKKDSSTDVLSFSGLEIKGGQERIGEIFICLEKIQENAQKDGQSFQKALNWAISHSVLHLLGYDHEKSEKDAKKMRQKEEKYLKK
ncbi:MAG: rRNA maturation RNase YbeY [Candidatus Pacebacteria bacterium]|nr:rRNA maturation RNase YbeY [Candidatus Paceibacterota bacterium]